MTDLSEAAVTLIVAAAAIARIPGAVRNPNARPLCTVLNALAAGILLWFVDRFGLLHIDEVLGIHNLTTLLSHLLGVAAAQATLTYLAMVTGVGNTPKAGHVRSLMSLLVAIGMITAFFLIDRPTQADDFFTAYAGSGMATAYWSIFMSCLVIALGSAACASLSYRSDADKSPLRTGLTWVGVGSLIGIVYAVHKIVYVVARDVGSEPITASASSATTSALFAVSLLCIAVGTMIPLAAERLRTYRKRRNARELERLWSVLVAVKPSIDLQAIEHVGDRIYRRYIEVEDGLLELRDYSDAHSFSKALDHANAIGLPGPRAEALAEAVRIRVAASRYQLRRRVPAQDRLRPAPVDDYDLEVARLLRVARVIQTQQSRAYADSLLADADFPIGEPPRDQCRRFRGRHAPHRQLVRHRFAYQGRKVPNRSSEII